ncbi:MAG: hypothetical protein R2839_03415 [Thermomicrobiales bacterium]
MAVRSSDWRATMRAISAFRARRCRSLLAPSLFDEGRHRQSICCRQCRRWVRGGSVWTISLADEGVENFLAVGVGQVLVALPFELSRGVDEEHGVVTPSIFTR